MKRALKAAVTRIALALLIAGCSPAMNWRTVQLQNLSATLPCKPDEGQRTVRLNGQDLLMQMKGCEADGALFAISHVLLADAVQAPEVQQAWRKAAISKLNGPERLSPQAELQVTTTWTPETVTGTGTDGAPLQAALAWRVTGTHIYHLAIYAQKISPEMTEPFFAAAMLP